MSGVTGLGLGDPLAAFGAATAGVMLEGGERNGER